MNEINYSKKYLKGFYASQMMKTETRTQTALAFIAMFFLFVIIGILLSMASSFISIKQNTQKIKETTYQIRTIESETLDTANMQYDYLTNDYTND